MSPETTPKSVANFASKSALVSVHKSWKQLPLSRDKADTLLLLTACFMVMLPHLPLLPWWVSAAAGGLMAWRAWLTLTGRRLPRTWVLLPIAMVLMAGVYLTYRSFFGRETGVTMLVLLLSCKLLEMHAKRDLFVVIFLDFFLLLTSFFYSQTILSAALATLAVLTLLTTLLSFQFTGVIPSLWQRTKIGLTILGLAIPLTIVSFFLFPRIQGPLWGLPAETHSGRSGLSDSMSPGNISSLALSEDIAFRAKFDGAPPEKSRLYWRGIVLNNFDGRSWSREDVMRISQPEEMLRTNGKAVKQQIILEASGQAWLFALDIPGSAPALTGMRSSLNTQFEIYSSRAINNRIRYDVISYPDYHLQTELTPRALRSALALPADANPKTRQFAENLRQRVSGDPQRIQEVLQLFRRENFVYTLEPPLLGQDSVDEFLFTTRAGFCEHYASSFVVLMRAMGIPARVVTGYQGGASNNVDGYMEVRQSDAHAWAEVWLSGRGWVRVDPTAAVAPGRVTLNLSSTQTQRGMAGLVNFAIGRNSWFQQVRMRWDAINNRWNLWILNFDQAKQIDILRSLGLSNLDWPQLAGLFFLAGSIVMGLVALPLLTNRPKISAIDRLYLTLCQKLAQQGLPRELHEAPYSYSQRIRSRMTEAKFAPILAFLTLYAAAKYASNAPSEAIILVQLKNLLAQCR